LGDLADKRYHLLRHVTIPWFISLPVTFVHCAQMADIIDTISLHMTVPCLSQIVSKFGLHRSTPSSPSIGDI